MMMMMMNETANKIVNLVLTFTLYHPLSQTVTKVLNPFNLFNRSRHCNLNAFIVDETNFNVISVETTKLILTIFQAIIIFF